MEIQTNSSENSSLPTKMGTAKENNGLSFTNFSRMMQNHIGQQFPELGCEALGIPAQYYTMPPPPNYPHDDDPILQEGLMHIYEKHSLPLYLKEAGMVQTLNLELDRNRKKAANAIKSNVTETLRSFIEREHPVSGDINWFNVDSIITIMQWIQSAYNLSISASSIDIHKHYKSIYDNIHFTTNDTIDTFILKFDEAYLQFKKHCPHRITLNEAITDFLHKLPSEFHNFRETMIMQEARNEELMRNNIPRINDTGYPLTLDALYKQVSVVSRVFETLSTKTSAKSFTSIARSNRSYSPRDSPARFFTNIHTGEEKTFHDFNMNDNPSDYGLSNCYICVRNGFQGSHLKRFHDQYMRSQTQSDHHSHRPSRHQSNFRTSKYRHRSRSRSSSQGSSHVQHQRNRSRSRSTSSQRDSHSSQDGRRHRSSRHISGKSSPHSTSPHTTRPPTPVPAVTFQN